MFGTLVPGCINARLSKSGNCFKKSAGVKLTRFMFCKISEGTNAWFYCPDVVQKFSRQGIKSTGSTTNQNKQLSLLR